MRSCRITPVISFGLRVLYPIQVICGLGVGLIPDAFSDLWKYGCALHKIQQLGYYGILNIQINHGDTIFLPVNQYFNIFFDMASFGASVVCQYTADNTWACSHQWILHEITSTVDILAFSWITFLDFASLVVPFFHPHISPRPQISAVRGVCRRLFTWWK